MAGGYDGGNNNNSGKQKVDFVYHLGSSDGPGNLITPIQLKGDNYDEWARAVRTALKAKRKFGFVDGTIAKPQDSEKLDDWVAVHLMLVSWLSNTLDPVVRFTIGDYDDASLLQTNLRNRYCVVSGTQKIRDDDYVHHFLIGLDDAYGPIRGQLLAQEPLPNVDRAYQQVVQAERLRGSDPTPPRDNAVAFKLQYDGRKPKSNDNVTKLCTHCNREGHDESDCFQLHGYLEWWGDRPRGGRGSTTASRGGGRAGGRGRGSNSAPVRANKTNGQAPTHSSNNSASNSTDGAALAGISSAQIQQLLDHLSSLKPKLHGKQDLGWIIDTGASNHVTCDLSSLTNVTHVDHCPVGLPDGKYANASKIGSVILDGGLMIKNVLYVPQLNCNLISASQLIDESNCVMQFTNKFCVIKDLMTRKVIGAGEQVDGLYYFRGVPTVKTLKIDGDRSIKLWQ
ncbi:uncharacterized protein LOC110688883 [Chenopodium quinoa]|uniref:uncharacterized protein LOC110688883 n=1 Tax=Chenopodium quinoa TaxID=63459 RepID=UPI000B78A52B|nr:uncharacterized protein LOC110688883 [Chenopodium quinoa]